jgi:hypothetical protein
MPDYQLSLIGDKEQVPLSPVEIMKNRDEPNPLSPVVVSYGGGKNSTAMLILLAKTGVKVDLILFADTGGESSETYNFIELFDQWLLSHGMPGITIIKRSPYPPSKTRKSYLSAISNFRFVMKSAKSIDARVVPYLIFWVGVVGSESATLEEHCLVNQTMPSKAYGRSSCSMQWKIEPQDHYVLKWLIDKKLCGIRKKGKSYIVDYPVRKMIGYHKGEISRLIDKSSGSMRDLDSGIYRYEYPLMTHGVDEFACVQIIASAGLPVPPKSSCFFCPNKKISEIMALDHELRERALLIESCESDGVHHIEGTSVKGLGRKFAWRDLSSLTELEKIGLDFRSSQMSCQCLEG